MLTQPCPMVAPALRKNLMVALGSGSADDRISSSINCTADSISLLSTCRQPRKTNVAPSRLVCRLWAGKRR